MDSTIFEKQGSSVEQTGQLGGGPAHRSPRFLAIDDDDAILLLIGNAMPKSYYDLALAPDGEEGLRMAIASPPDLISSKLNTPRDVRRATVAGGSCAYAQDSLVKPFSVEELRVRVVTGCLWPALLFRQ